MDWSSTEFKGPTPRMGIIVAHLAHQRDKLEAVVADLDDEEARMLEGAGGWSIADHLNHLSKVERLMVQLVHSFLARAEDEGSPAAAPRHSSADAIEEIREILAPFARFADVALKAPAAVVPDPMTSAIESLRELRSTRGRLYGVCADAARFDLRGLLHYHYTLGVELDPYAWLGLHAEHEARHTRHIRAILATR